MSNEPVESWCSNWLFNADFWVFFKTSAWFVNVERAYMKSIIHASAFCFSWFRWTYQLIEWYVKLDQNLSFYNISWKMTYERGIKNNAIISINFSMNTFAGFSASLNGIMRTFKRCRRACRIGKEYLRSFLVLMQMFLALVLNDMGHIMWPYS